MSYILDALKKAEKERRSSVISDLVAVQAPLPIEAKVRTIRFPTMVTIFLVISFISLLWFGVWHVKKTPVQVAELQRHPEELTAGMRENSADMTSAMKGSNAHASFDNATGPEKTSPIVLQPKSVPKSQENPEQSGRAKPHAMAMTSPTIIPVTPESLKDLPPPDENRLYSLQELPDALKQTLPDFSFSVFLYTDDPAARTVRVNGLTMKEGQFTAEGLKLEEIRPEGVIFSYMNYHFHVRIP